MKTIQILFFMMLLAASVSGQTSKAESTGMWDVGSSWVGGVFPGSTGSAITLSANTAVIDGTIMSKKTIALNLLSNVTIKAGDTLVVLGDLNINTSTLTNNGVLVVMGNVNNTLGTMTNNGSGKMVVTGNYTNGLGSNTFTGPSYAYGAINGFLFTPNLKSKANLISADMPLYNYINSMYSSLPVELISFDVQVSGSSILLSWKTASEINNDYFVIERSSDGKLFEVVAEPKGAGNSKEQRSYSFTDSNPLEGNSYYRLSQVDYDGRTEQFNVLYVNNKVINAIEIYPNPTTRYLFVKAVSGDYRIVIRDQKGIVIGTALTPEDIAPGKLGIDVSNFNAGIYFLEIRNNEDNTTNTLRFVKG